MELIENEKRGKKEKKKKEKEKRKEKEKKKLPDFNSLHPFRWAREVSDSLK